MGREFYERVVGFTKRTLKKTISNKLLTQKQLITNLTEVEAVINNHLLVCVDDITSSSPYYHELLSTSLSPYLTEETDLVDFTRKALPNNHCKFKSVGRNTYLNKFWKLWRNEY